MTFQAYQHCLRGGGGRIKRYAASDHRNSPKFRKCLNSFVQDCIFEEFQFVATRKSRHNQSGHENIDIWCT